MTLRSIAPACSEYVNMMYRIVPGWSTFLSEGILYSATALWVGQLELTATEDIIDFVR